MYTQDSLFFGVSARGAELLKRHAIYTDMSVRDALAAINALSGEAMTLFAIDREGLLAGTVTDGDIRRALISGVEISEPVEKVMHTRFISATPGDDVCVAIAEGRRRNLSLVPVVKDGRIVDVLDLNKQ